MGMRIPSAAVHGNNVAFRNYLKGMSFIFQRHPEKCIFSLKKIPQKLKGGICGWSPALILTIDV